MYTVGLDDQFRLILYSLLFIYISYSAKNNTTLNHNNLEFAILDDHIKEIIFGSLLGDGQIEMAPRAKNARFGFIQSKSKKSYFLSVLNDLSVISTGNFRENSYTDKRTGKTYTSLSFWSKALPVLNEFYIGFYNEKAKAVPTDLSLLTPLALAHLVMQDGFRGTPKGLYICTDSFSHADVLRLSLYLMKRYQIKCSIHKAGSNYRIYVLARYVETLKTLILPYMHESMLYKLGI